MSRKYQETVDVISVEGEQYVLKETGEVFNLIEIRHIFSSTCDRSSGCDTQVVVRQHEQKQGFVYGYEDFTELFERKED